jgi:hypothetical protein
VETHGSPHNRYNAAGILFNTGHLLALDALLHCLRGKICGAGIRDSFKTVALELIAVFEDNNPWFCADSSRAHSKIPSKEFRPVLSGSGTRLGLLINTKDSISAKYALQWLALKMKLPKA